MFTIEMPLSSPNLGMRYSNRKAIDGRWSQRNSEDQHMKFQTNKQKYSGFQGTAVPSGQTAAFKLFEHLEAPLVIVIGTVLIIAVWSFHRTHFIISAITMIIKYIYFLIPISVRGLTILKNFYCLIYKVQVF